MTVSQGARRRATSAIISLFCARSFFVLQRYVSLDLRVISQAEPNATFWTSNSSSSGMNIIKPVWETFSVAFYVLLTVSVSATQARTTAQQRDDDLRLQLQEVQAKLLEMQQRLQVLDEQLKAENIEKSLVGVGSTRPEDLRELSVANSR
jgi:hypothetical protein